MRIGSISLKLVSMICAPGEFEACQENAEVLPNHVDFVQNDDVGKFDLVCKQVDGGSTSPSMSVSSRSSSVSGPKSLKKLAASTTVTMVST